MLMEDEMTLRIKEEEKSGSKTNLSRDNNLLSEAGTVSYELHDLSQIMS